jgi:YVTN family beta-propeller protein
MKRFIRAFPAIAAFAIAAVLGSTQSLADDYAYITNETSDAVFVIDINPILRNSQSVGGSIIATIPLGSDSQPWGVAVTTDGSRVYIANRASKKDHGSVSVIDPPKINTSSSPVIATIDVQGHPEGIAVTPNGSKVYVTSPEANKVSVIDTATQPPTVKTIEVQGFPLGVAVNPKHDLVYVTRQTAGFLSAINTQMDTVAADIALRDGSDSRPYGVAVKPSGDKVYVANSGNGTVSVFDAFSYQETVVNLPPGSRPVAVALPKSGDRLWIGSQDNNKVFVMNTKNNDQNNQIVMPSGCMPFGLAGTSIELGEPDTRIFSVNELVLWVALEGLTCNEVGEFDAQRHLNHNPYAIFANPRHPIAFGQFIGPAPKQSAGLTAQSAATGDPCSGPFDGTINGDLTVADGESCEVVNGGRVTGNVTVKAGGNFILSGATVGGSVTVDGGGFTLGPAAMVGGDLLVSNLPAGITENSVCGTTVQGTLQVDGNAAPVQIGSSAPMVCAGNKIGGDLVVDGNSAPAQVFDNQVKGQLQADNNTGLLDVVGNTVGTTLKCQNNTMLIMGDNNTARQTTGQCH